MSTKAIITLVEAVDEREVQAVEKITATMIQFFIGTSPRFYCPDSPAFGHLSSTIAILKRFIAMGFITQGEIVYENLVVLQKLTTLLPQIDFKQPIPIKVKSQGREATVKLTLQPDNPLPLEEKFAITGGWDHHGKVVEKVRILNVDVMLVLQPYTWELQDTQAYDLVYFRKASTEIKLAEAIVEFNDMLYFRPVPAVSEEEWMQLAALPDKKELIAAAQAVVNGVNETKALFCPAYGISNVGTKTPLMAPPPGAVLFNLCSAVRLLQEQGRAKRMVILVLTEFKAQSWKMLGDWVAGKNLDKQAMEFAKKYLCPSGVEKVLLRNDLSNAQEIYKAIQTLGEDQVLILNLQGLPQDVFDLYYRMASLPAILEGAGTASLVMNLGIPYCRFAPVAYPVLPLCSQPSPESLYAAEMMKLMVTMTQTWNEDFIPPILIAKYILETWDSQSKIAQYFIQFANYLKANANNDKLFRALSLVFSCKQFGESFSDLTQHMLVGDRVKRLARKGKAEVPAAIAKAGDDPVLDKVYDDLIANLSDGTLNLVPGAFPEGPIADLFQSLCEDKTFVITSAQIDPPAAGEVAVSGKTNSLLGIPGLDVNNLVFTNGDLGLTSTLHVLRNDLSWNLENVPWFSLRSPFFDITQTNNEAPTSGAVGSSIAIGSTVMDVKLGIPVIQNKWIFQAAFSGKQPGISDLFQLVGGINLAQILPPPINVVADLKVQQFELMYDRTSGAVGYFSVQVGTSQSWPLFGNIVLGSLTIQALVSAPGDLKNRTTKFDINASFPLGPGSVAVSVSVPGLVFSGRLVPPEDPLKHVELGDVASLFLPSGQTISINGNINQFSFNYNRAASTWAVSCAVETDWPITIAGATLFTITGLGFSVQGASGNVTGNFNGSTIILPDSANINLSVSASYDGPEAGWTFEGRTTEPISVGNLLKSAPFHFDAGSQAGYNIDSLSLIVATGDNSWTFEGTFSDWKIEFLDLTIKRASVKAGQKSTTGAIFNHPALRNSTVALLARTDDTLSTFAELEADIVWFGIEITSWIKFSKGSPSWGFTWKQLTGLVEKNDKLEWIGTLKFADNVTLGSMIEDMVSWITGSKFGLEAPWNFLDSIKLSNLSLIYNFTKNTVAFGIDIGPIDLGFARIDSIRVSYGPNPKDENKRGVLVSLTGSFPWNVGQDAEGDASTLGPWDASQPGTAPAPPGNGNKYLDLRMLAMGQHVHVTGLEQSKTVQEAIALMEDMPDPEPGKIPPVVFDPQSAWLFGTDFGVLRLDDKKEASKGNVRGNGASLMRNMAPTIIEHDGKLLQMKAPKAGLGYFMTLQIIFNDPSFYALRIALDGEPAKILKGLDFQILYRQVSETVGVYQTEITLPDAMRHLGIGVYSITLPVFGIWIYTNGDFQVDIGFPWNSNFARSFSIEGIIYPGIPVLGSAGFYFGKLSSASTNKVPQTTLGTFNPVIVFGFGLQIGFGKSIEYGVLKAGFSLTVVGILEGVIGKWNPYQLTEGGSGGDSQIQGAYYFWLQGTVGIIGKLYGSVDFAIIKASVNVELKLLIQLTYESYVSVSVTVIASVDVSASLEINLGIFSITLHFSFSLRLKETFTMLNSGQAPWQIGSGNISALQGSANRRLHAVRKATARLPMLAQATTLNWNNLKKPDAGPAPLSGYLAPALTVARDEWAAQADPSMQVPCYVASIFIDSVAPTNQDSHTSALKAAGQAVDTSFETLCKTVLRWMVASLQPSPLSASDVDNLLISAGTLDLLNESLVSTDSAPTPIPESAIDSFLTNQFLFAVQVPPANTRQNVNATYFPMAPLVKLVIPAYSADYAGCNYSFGAYNSIDSTGLTALRHYFDDLAVQVSNEMQNQPAPNALPPGVAFSMSDWIYTDYFLLLARQMVQAASEALRDFKYPITTGQTTSQVVTWINNTGQLADGDAYTVSDLFAANQTHLVNAGSKLAIGVTYAIDTESFNVIATKILNGATGALELAQANASKTDILRAEQVINYPGKTPYVVKAGNSLSGIAQTLGVQLTDLLLNTSVLAQSGLLLPDIKLALPGGREVQANSETFTVIAKSLYGCAFAPSDLALANAANSQILRAGAVISIPGKASYTVQAADTLITIAKVFNCQVGELVINAGLLSQIGLLAPQSTLFIPLVRCQSQASDSFQSIASQAVYAGAFTAAAFAGQNAGFSILRTGAKIEYAGAGAGQSPYVVQPRDCLGDVANYFGISLADLFSHTSVLAQTDLLIGVAVLFTPTFACTAQASDTLQTLAARYATTVSVIADQPANGDVADLFALVDASQKPDPYLDVPHLAQFRVGELIAECQRSLALQHLSSMTSRYYLHGLRLPTEHIQPLQKGMWVKDSGGKLALPEYAGLYALTGQQFALPEIQSKDFAITFDNSAGPAWLQFNDSQKKKTSQLQILITPSSDDAKRISALTDYARKNRLEVKVNQLGPGTIAESELASYPFPSSLIWQSAAPVVLPYSPSQSGVPSLKLWRIPDAMLGLSASSADGSNGKSLTRAVDPRFKLQVARYDEATGSTQKTDAENYGWATIIEFTIKKIPAVSSSPASATTYEVAGAGGNDIVLLERMIAEIGNNKAYFDQLVLGYAPEQNGDGASGVQTDPPASVTMGIAQVDLSTDTRPASTSLALMSTKTALLNSVPEFITLLWEASITRSGGFYLYYYNAADGVGLPDRIFNDKNEATLSLIVLYAKPPAPAEQDAVASFMNAVAAGDSIDSANSVLFAQANPPATTIVPDANATLATMAYAYFSDIGDLAQLNSSLPLTAGCQINANQGVFQAPVMGMSLATIAQQFSTKATPLTVNDLLKANPRGPLPDPLFFPAAINLPPVTVTSGTDAYSATLGQISEFFGENLTALAAKNQDVQGLFAATVLQPVTIPGGPRTRHASVPPGVISVEAVRPVPPPVPEKFDDPNYGKYSLLNLYTLLSYRIADNDYFRHSSLGLPAGPTTKPADPANTSKVRRARTLTADDVWYYKQSLPYPKFIRTKTSAVRGLPQPDENPYRALACLLQVDYEWQDNYGNTLVTTLSDPQNGDAGPRNQAPMLTGYTDAIINVNQWPAVSANWQVVPLAGSDPQLEIRISFDSSKYQGMLQASALAGGTQVLAKFTLPLDPKTACDVSNYKLDNGASVLLATLSVDGQSVTLTTTQLGNARYALTIQGIKTRDAATTFSGEASFDFPDNPDSYSSTVQGKALQDLRAYTQVFFQFTDPNGIACSIESTLFETAQNPQGSLALTSAQVSDLRNWLFYGSGTATSIFAFLQERSQFKSDVALPPGEHIIRNGISPAQVNSAQVFKLSLTFTIARTSGMVAGDLQTTSGIHQSSANMAARVEKVAATGNAVGITQFAQNFQNALSIENSYRMKIATGVDRYRAGNGSDSSTLWAVRTGWPGKPIGYKITPETAGNPQIFAPRPVSNQLKNDTVAIRDYSTGKGIAPSATRTIDFVDIDVDVWMQQFFGSVDGLLAPQYTAPMQIVGKKKNRDYIGRILKQKKTLAAIAKRLMIPAFAGESADATAAQEAFYQQMLSRLSNAYSTRAAMQFTADVKADVPYIPGYPPQLYGNIILNKMTSERSGAQSGTGEEGESRVAFTSPKLALETKANQPFAFLLSAPDTVRSDTGSVVPAIRLDLTYNGTSIEHQISPVPGIHDYHASTWLNFVIRDKDWPLQQPLGEFPVPMFLRAFPASPSVTAQRGDRTYSDDKDLSRVTRWNYAFTYSLPFHYPHDVVYCAVEFNVKDLLAKPDELKDAFPQLAQFITVFPAVDEDLQTILAEIDAAKQDRLEDAAVALLSFCDMVDWIITAAGGTRADAEGMGLVMHGPRKRLAGTLDLTYAFRIEEGFAVIDDQRALRVNLIGQPPAGIGVPVVLIDPDHYNCIPFLKPDADCDKPDRFCFVYQNKTTGRYLNDTDGQRIPERNVVLQDMDILQRQDAWSTVLIKRNEELVPTRRSAEPFIYQTPNVQFANALHPVIDSDIPISLPELGTSQATRSLQQALEILFQRLFADTTTPTVVIQVEVSYEYSINSSVQSVSLPVLMQAPLEVVLSSAKGVALEQMITDWSQAIELWFTTHLPNGEDGVLWFDISIMSNLTAKPMPLLRLRKLYLPIDVIEPPLSTGTMVLGVHTP